ncbi:hypothetical protein CAPTEDRAFT_158826 [Capitella teleta]|uniref:Radical S-adenosyl methionine domain-containing protein 1, mitochondrial n=1 Tax=Capitella teleta TaxID=283909 RepID=R7U1Z6_CAPTE|nr:hypothetical protein CAPTEDRAFT_158826 [Capitella teleta]|eukprot:ELT99882.1 hypothetical protein CAPTEDRAFT_158826 [Capitella teleta]
MFCLRKPVGRLVPGFHVSSCVLHSASSLQSASTSTEHKKRTEEAALYVHWPYCEKRCTYCNFNKYINPSVDHERMRKCLVTETQSLLEISRVSLIKSIFFGGGTPSLAHPETIGKVIETVKRSVNLAADAEVTLEANPTSTEEKALKEFKSAGINRVSIGLQSLNPADLKVLGRTHSAEDALRCLDTARSLFPGKTSVDIIFGCPDHKTSTLIEDLARVVDLCDDHISLYQLTLERGTALFKHVMDRDLYLPSPDAMADMYEASLTFLEEQDFRRYEVSNFARTKSAQSSHNQSYWEGGQFIGVGPGAHSRFVARGENATQRMARVQTLEPEPWMIEVEKSGHATRKADALSEYEVLQEILYLGLRTTGGVPHERWNFFSPDASLLDVFSEAHMIKVLQKEGYLHSLSGGLRATSRGLNLADGLTKELFLILERFWEMHRKADQ